MGRIALAYALSIGLISFLTGLFGINGEWKKADMLIIQKNGRWRSSVHYVVTSWLQTI